MLESPNLDRFLDTVIARIGCKKHNATAGLPCFHISKIGGLGYHAAVCNKRAIAAGFVGKIMPQSLSMKRSSNGKRS